MSSNGYTHYIHHVIHPLSHFFLLITSARVACIVLSTGTHILPIRNTRVVYFEVLHSYRTVFPIVSMYLGGLFYGILNVSLNILIIYRKSIGRMEVFI